MSHAVLFALGKCPTSPVLIQKKTPLCCLLGLRSNEAIVAVIVVVVHDECDLVRQMLPIRGVGYCAGNAP